MSGLARVAVASGGRTETLELPWETSLQEVLTQAREALAVSAASDVELYCADGTVMGNKLQRTLGELRERRMCPRLEFELRPVVSA